MSDTADTRPTQAADVVFYALGRLIQAGPAPSQHEAAMVIIAALRDAGYVIVPRSAVAAALERKDAAV